MFIHPNRLTHVLSAEEYYSPLQYQRELNNLLRPSWHFVTTTFDLSKEGDFVTLFLLDQPVMVVRQEGEFLAIRNQRPGQYTPLSTQRQGSIRDIRLSQHNESLLKVDLTDPGYQQYASARCGELIFVNFSASPIRLRDQLGATFPQIERGFSAPFRQVWSWICDYEANWKIPLENGVESYHIPCLHAATFRNYPREENIDHEIHPEWTSYRTNEMDRWVKNSIRRTTRWLGLPFTGQYTHYHVFPNLTFVLMDLMSLAQIVVPTSPTTSRTMVWLFTPFGPRRGMIPWLFAKGNAWASREVAKRVLAEDAPIFPAVQRGIQASPFSGVIGRREERVWAFQEYVSRLSSPNNPE